MGSARSIGILTSINAVGAVISVTTTIVIAHLFGTTRALEVFFAASALRASVTSLTQTGQLTELFLPIYHRVKHSDGQSAAHGAFSVIVNWMILVATGISILIWLGAPLLIRLLVPGFTAEDHLLGVRMVRWLVPLLCIQVILALIQMLAHAEKRFGVPEAITLATRVGNLAGIAAMYYFLGIWAMVVSLWIGSAIHLAGYLVLLRRMGYRHRFQLHQRGFGAWPIFRKLFVTFSYTGATQVYVFALNAGVSTLPQGTYAVVQYVLQIYDKTRSVFLRPVSVVFFTDVSVALMKAAGTVRDLTRAALARYLAIGSLILLAIVASARPLLGAMWGGKRFGPESLDLAAWLMGLMYIRLFASGFGQILRKVIMGLGMVTSQYIGSSLVQLLSAGASFGLIYLWGVHGCIAALLFNAVGLGLVPLVILLLRRRDLVVFYPVHAVWRWCVAGGLGGLSGMALKMMFEGQTLIAGRVGLFLWACALAGTSVAVALVVAWLLRVYEVRELARRVHARLRQRGITAE